MSDEERGEPRTDGEGPFRRSRGVRRLTLALVVVPVLLLAWSHLRSPASAVDLPSQCGGFAWAGTDIICNGVAVRYYDWRTAKVRVRLGQEWNRTHGTDFTTSCPVYVTVRRTWLGWEAGAPWQGNDCVGDA